MIKQKLHMGAIIGGIVYIASCTIVMIKNWFIAYFDADNIAWNDINSMGERDLELGIHIIGIILSFYLCYVVYKQLYYGHGRMTNLVVVKGE